MVEYCGVCAGYGGRAVVRDLSLTLRDGELTVLIGPNGSGKSTLIRSALGLTELLSGRILLDGQDRAGMDPVRRAKAAAYMPQNRPVPAMTASTLVLHGRFPHLGYPRRYSAEDRRIVREALETVGASDLADEPVTSLSGGQAQRVYIAMALAQQTQTILMDEPTSFLDVRYQTEVMRLGRALAAQGKAVAMIVHDLCLAMRYADRIAVLSGGTLKAQGTPEEIFAQDILEPVFGVRLCRIGSGDGWRYYYD